MNELRHPSADRNDHDPRRVAHSTRAGLRLFLVYVTFYGGFMALSAFWPELMSREFLGGANLAVVYGFALILGALVLALVYLRVCRNYKPEQS